MPRILTIPLAALLLLAAAPAMAVKEPAFEVIDTFQDVEIRRYKPFVIAEVTISSDFEDAGNQAFRILADYIGGANQGADDIEMTAPVIQSPASGESMEMTAPVLQRSAADSGRHAVAFVLPARYELVASAPRPTDPRVRLRQTPSRIMAAVRYRGFWSQELYRKHEAHLLAVLGQAGYGPVGTPEWARYDPPFMPWFLRRNEVMVEVRKTSGTGN